MRAIAEIEPPRVAAAPVLWTLPDRGIVGMVSFIIAESAIFTIFVVAYLFYVGKNLTGPTPRDVLEVPIFYTICLLSSSVTIHLAGRHLERNESRAFGVLWLITIALGAIFLFGTAEEWRRLIYKHGLTISTNLFGTTYYSLVGLHAFHVTIGLVMLTTLLLSVVAGARTPSARIEVLSLYWHFVDAVWVVVFTVVYMIGR
ncbi:MAG TPA: cytochrome c oxidase subunit 3 [Vicinamibacterales bacterium]|nr:cytochrome c oxidase subunit 3 [Vicinamibacterales bacterium]